MRAILNNKNNNQYKNDDYIDLFLYNLLFTFLMIIEVVIEFFKVVDYNYFMKPFILIVLTVFLTGKTKIKRTKKERYIINSLICYLTQVILILICERGIFLIIRYCLMTFSLILSILSFQMEIQHVTMPISKYIKMNLPFAIILIFLMSFINITTETIIPCLLYTLLLLVCIITANLRQFTCDDKSYKIILFSFSSLILSEFLFAIHKFNDFNHPGINVLITLSFYLSQYLLVYDFMKNKSNNSIQYHQIPII